MILFEKFFCWSASIRKFEFINLVRIMFKSSSSFLATTEGKITTHLQWGMKGILGSKLAGDICNALLMCLESRVNISHYSLVVWSIWSNRGTLWRIIAHIKKNWRILNFHVLFKTPTSYSFPNTRFCSFSPFWRRKMSFPDSVTVLWMITNSMDLISTIMENKFVGRFLWLIRQ